MSITKHALIRYKCLNKCFRNPQRRYDIHALVEECNKAIQELEPKSKGIKKRQLYEDIRFMKSEQGWFAPIETYKDGVRAFYRYEDSNFSIDNQPFNEAEAKQLESVIEVLSIFEDRPEFEFLREFLLKLKQTFGFDKESPNIMAFQTNEFLKGKEFLGDLFNMILYKKVIKVFYRPYMAEKNDEYTVNPYFLKQYNNRWFLFAAKTEDDFLMNFALDRIEDVQAKNETYDKCPYDFNEYFEDVIGVTRNDGDPIIIKIHAKPESSKYILTKPLHGSQKNIQYDENGLIFTIEVIPNFELFMLLLSYGENIKILEPTDFQEQMKKKIEKMLSNYQ